MLKIILTKGLPASGKDTWATKMIRVSNGKFKRVNKDMLRLMLDDNKWSKDNEKIILNARDSLIKTILQSGNNVIVSDTNFGKTHEERIRQLANSFSKENKIEVIVEIIDFTHVPIEECIKRDLNRPISVGEKVIRQMYNQFLRPNIPKIKHNFTLPDCIICDLDGTLAILNGRNPYDASTCENDELNQPLANILLTMLNDSPLSLRKPHLFFFSGREDKYRAQTESWINNKIGNYADLIIMRKTGDHRKDSIVKKEFYFEYVKDKYNVLAIFDDRLQVCRMWNELGLPLFRVGDPEADF